MIIMLLGVSRLVQVTKPLAFFHKNPCNIGTSLTKKAQTKYEDFTYLSLHVIEITELNDILSLESQMHHVAQHLYMLQLAEAFAQVRASLIEMLCCTGGIRQPNKLKPRQINQAPWFNGGLSQNSARQIVQTCYIIKLLPIIAILVELSLSFQMLTLLSPNSIPGFTLCRSKHSTTFHQLFNESKFHTSSLWHFGTSDLRGQKINSQLLNWHYLQNSTETKIF